MNKLEDFEKRINSLNSKESEAKGVIKTYTSKLKELGISNMKEAKSKMMEYKSQLESISNDKIVLEKEIDEKLTIIENNLK